MLRSPSLRDRGLKKEKKKTQGKRGKVGKITSAIPLGKRYKGTDKEPVNIQGSRAITTNLIVLFIFLYEQYRNRTYPSLNDKFFYREPPLPFGAPALLINI